MQETVNVINDPGATRLGGIAVSDSPAAATIPVTDAQGMLCVPGGGTGTPGTNVTAETVGDGRDFTTVLTLSGFVVGALAGSAAALGLGAKVFTLPAGAQIIHASHMSVGLTAAGTTGTPKIGLGSVVATGAVSALSGTATFMDYITQQTAADLAGTPTVKTAVATAGALAGIAINEAASVKDIFLNAAETWAADNTGNLTASGKIMIRWTQMS
jgi:hypothetical protein